MAADKIFLEGLNEIKKADPDKSTEGAAKLFHAIEEMRLDTVIASKRTLNLFRSLNNMNEVTSKVVTQVDDALIARAAIIWTGNASKSTFIALVSAFGEHVTKKRIVREDEFRHHFERLRLKDILT